MPRWTFSGRVVEVDGYDRAVQGEVSGPNVQGAGDAVVRELDSRGRKVYYLELEPDED
ncbi:hypothetical protein [Streptomyces acidicola]|uniref:hypothetical protein n=1 Tax=Streptomyces acidicola TaxID=2596892 RepID=UPI001883822F|nr:hypothetical protein [Streptomyces acidicola]